MRFKIIDDIYDDFYKELDKANKEGYISADDACLILLNGEDK